MILKLLTIKLTKKYRMQYTFVSSGSMILFDILCNQRMPGDPQPVQPDVKPPAEVSFSCLQFKFWMWNITFFFFSALSQ